MSTPLETGCVCCAHALVAKVIYFHGCLSDLNCNESIDKWCTQVLQLKCIFLTKISDFPNSQQDLICLLYLTSCALIKKIAKIICKSIYYVGFLPSHVKCIYNSVLCYYTGYNYNIIHQPFTTASDY